MSQVPTQGKMGGGLLTFGHQTKRLMDFACFSICLNAKNTKINPNIFWPVIETNRKIYLFTFGVQITVL